MALRLRRGTDVQRQAIVPLEGELIYTTDTKELYVGDGTTLGGILVSAEVSDDTSPVLGGNLDLNGNDIVGTGDINIDGTITATGNINLGDGAEDNVIVGGQIGSSLIPKVSDSYDLGAAAGRWNKVHAFNGVFGGDVEVGNLVTNGNIVKSDSTVIYDAATDSLTVSSITAGAFEGNFKGSVFADDSSAIVDAINSAIYADTLNTANIIPSVGGAINIGSPDSNARLERFNSAAGIITRCHGIADGNTGSDEIYNISRGSYSSPTSIQVGDILYSQSIAGYETSVGDYQSSTAIVHYSDPYGTIGGGAVPGAIALITIPDGDPNNTENAVTLDSTGAVSINRDLTQARATLDIGGAMALKVLDAAPSTPVDGMIAIADGATWDPSGSNPTKKQLVVWFGAWVQLAIQP